MIQTGMLAATVLVFGLVGPASAGLPSTSPTLAYAVEPSEIVDNDVIRPPLAEIDPDMTVVPPTHGGRMPIIPPPGTRGGERGIDPR